MGDNKYCGCPFAGGVYVCGYKLDGPINEEKGPCEGEKINLS